MRVFAAIAVLVPVLDQVTKHIIKTSMKMYDSITVIKDIFRITYIENTGIAFGIFNGIPHPAVRWTLASVMLVAMAAITAYWAMHRKKGFVFNLSCGLILGGAIGNFIDRVIIGRVTDFIEVGWKQYTWPVFNIADSAVSVGVCLFILFLLLEKNPAKAG